jgi:hypothetical protein
MIRVAVPREQATEDVRSVDARHVDGERALRARPGFGQRVDLRRRTRVDRPRPAQHDRRRARFVIHLAREQADKFLATKRDPRRGRGPAPYILEKLAIAARDGEPTRRGAGFADDLLDHFL